MKKIKVPSELVYAVAIIILSFSVAMMSCADLGLSMIVSPAYILSCKIGLTFGQCEYIVQGILFVVFCVLMKKIKLVYLSSFITGLIYGAVLDFWRLVIPHFNPEITAPGSVPMWLRIIYFLLGMFMTSLSIAMFFKTYLYPQIYDFFVKGIAEKYRLNQTKFKIGFDMSMLAISVVMTLVLFRRFVGIGVGTLIMACINGVVIGFFGKMLDKFFIIEPKAKKFSKYFDIT